MFVSSFEIFQTFDADNQKELLSTIDELIYADGSVHPAEAKFRAELDQLLQSTEPLSPADIEILRDQSQIAITNPAKVQTRLENHPFFATFEQHYSADPDRIKQQIDAALSLIAAARGSDGRISEEDLAELSELLKSLGRRN